MSVLGALLLVLVRVLDLGGPKVVVECECVGDVCFCDGFVVEGGA